MTKCLSWQPSCPRIPGGSDRARSCGDRCDVSKDARCNHAFQIELSAEVFQGADYISGGFRNFVQPGIIGFTELHSTGMLRCCLKRKDGPLYESA